MKDANAVPMEQAYQTLFDRHAIVVAGQMPRENARIDEIRVGAF